MFYEKTTANVVSGERLKAFLYFNIRKKAGMPDFTSVHYSSECYSQSN